MPPNDAVVGVNMLVAVDGTLIAGQTGADLSISQELREILTKTDANWASSLSGRQQWSISSQSVVLDENADAYIANGKATLELEIPDGAGGTQTVEVPRLSSIDFTLAQNLAPTGGLDRALWRYLRPAERRWSIDIQGSYVDPLGDKGDTYDAILTAKSSGARLPATLTVDGKTFSGEVAPGDLTISAQTGGEDAQVSVAFGGDGPMTQAGEDFPTGLEEIFDLFETQNEVDAAMEYHEDGSQVAGATQFTGSGYFSEVSLSIADGEEITMSSTLEGNGPLSPTAQN